MDKLQSPILLCLNHCGISQFLSKIILFNFSNSFDGKGVIALWRDTNINELNSTYPELEYRTYNNKYKGIDYDVIKKQLNNKINLSKEKKLLRNI